MKYQIEIDRKLGYRCHKWDEEEDKLILEGFISDEDLAVALRCSISAIQTRRCRLKKGKEQ